MLVGEFYEVAYRWAFTRLHDGDLAQDATQEAFISAYQSLIKFREGNFKAWLLRITTNGCYDELRRRKRLPQSSLEGITEDNDESFAFLRDPAIGPESRQQQRELIQAIESCLQGLPDDQRVTAVLCDIGGYDYNEIADITDVSLGTVKSRISRARSKLRDCLQGFKELLPENYRLQGE